MPDDPEANSHLADLQFAFDTLAETFLAWEAQDPRNVKQRYWAWVKRVTNMRISTIRDEDYPANDP